MALQPSPPLRNHARTDNCNQADQVLKKKKCKARDPDTGLRCNNEFDPRAPWQIACSPVCGLNIAAEKKAKQAVKDGKKQRQERRAGLIAIKSRADWMREAQAAFNAYARSRALDSCISCGSKTGKQNAGHYRSVGSCPELRFEPLNVWMQCEKCNSYLSGNLINYRKNLLKLIGEEKLNWIEGYHPPKKYTIPELQEIIATYRKKLKELKNAN